MVAAWQWMPACAGMTKEKWGTDVPPNKKSKDLDFTDRISACAGMTKRDGGVSVMNKKSPRICGVFFRFDYYLFGLTFLEIQWHHLHRYH